MPHDRNALLAWLEWYREAGVDELIGETPVDRLAAGPDRRALASRDVGSQARMQERAVPPAGAAPRPRLRGAASARESAREIAAACQDLRALEAALAAFDGCALKETALHLCFADGSPDAEVMLVGEAPGAEEDRLGKPFVGPSGQLLDRMLATIDLDRTRVWITNLIFWRPPGNRPPTSAEISICLPFLERQIELLRPKIVVFLGGAAARALLGLTEGVTKLRGRRFAHTCADGTSIPCMITFHPAYLLRQPAQKRFAWRDLLALRRQLQNA